MLIEIVAAMRARVAALDCVMILGHITVNDHSPRMRFSVLDGWRGVCALMVALSHIDLTGALYGVPLIGGSFLFVDFFFVLSGFVLAHAYGDRTDHWAAASTLMIRRFGRLYPLHFVMLSAFVGWEALRGIRHVLPSGIPPFAGDLAPRTIVSHLLLMNSWGFDPNMTWNMPSWSIGAEFYTYFIFAALCVLARRYLLELSVAIAVGAALFIAAVSPRYMDLTFDYGFYRCLYGFFVGLLTYQFYRRYREISLPGATLCEIAAVLGAIAFVSLFAWSAVSFAAPLLFAAVVFVFAFERGRFSAILSLPPLQKLGAWSYSIYMVHFLVIELLDRAVRDTEKLTGHNYYAEIGHTAVLSFGPPFVDRFALAYIVAIIAVASLTYRYIEVPGRRFFNSLASRRSPPLTATAAAGVASAVRE